MEKDALNNVHISAEQVLITPEELKKQFPLSEENKQSIAQSRKTIADIVAGRDPRLLAFGIKERLIPFLDGQVIKKVDLTAQVIEVDWDPGF